VPESAQGGDCPSRLPLSGSGKAHIGNARGTPLVPSWTRSGAWAQVRAAVFTDAVRAAAINRG
jgi:hypothetical protein